jgi:hypothetical protein
LHAPHSHISLTTSLIFFNKRGIFQKKQMLQLPLGFTIWLLLILSYSPFHRLSCAHCGVVTIKIWLSWLRHLKNWFKLIIIIHRRALNAITLAVTNKWNRRWQCHRIGVGGVCGGWAVVVIIGSKIVVVVIIDSQIVVVGSVGSRIGCGCCFGSNSKLRVSSLV